MKTFIFKLFYSCCTCLTFCLENAKFVHLAIGILIYFKSETSEELLLAYGITLTEYPHRVLISKSGFLNKIILPWDGFYASSIYGPNLTAMNTLLRDI